MAKQQQAETAKKEAPKTEQIAPRATKPSQPVQRVVSKANGNPKLARRIQQGGSISTNELAALILPTL